MGNIYFKRDGNDVCIKNSEITLGHAKYTFDKLGALDIYCEFADGIKFKTKNKGLLFWRNTQLLCGNEVIGNLTNSSLKTSSISYKFDRSLVLHRSGQQVATLMSEMLKGSSINILAELDDEAKFIMLLCLRVLRPTVLS